MYKNVIADTKMNWYENKHWPASNATENVNTRALLGNSSNDFTDGADLETIIGNAPLDLSVFGDSEQPRNAESPLDLSCKTRKRCADSTEERQFYIHRNEPVEKKICFGLNDTHIRFMSNENSASESKIHKKHQIDYNNTPPANRNNNQGNRQNCVRSICDIQPNVIKQYNISHNSSQCPTNIPQNMRMNYVSPSCQSNSTKLPTQVEKQPTHQSHITSVQNGKVTNNYMIPHQHSQQQQRHQTSQNSQSSRVLQLSDIPRSQCQQAYQREQQQQQQQQQQHLLQKTVMQQPHTSINTQSTLMSPRQNDVTMTRHNSHVPQQEQNGSNQYHRQNSEGSLYTTQRQSVQYVQKCGSFMPRQQSVVTQQQKNTGFDQYGRHIKSSSVLQEKDFRSGQRSENKIDDRKSCIQQPVRYQNVAYSKQQLPSNINVLHQKSAMSQHQGSVKPTRAINSQYMMQSTSSIPSFTHSPHQLYPPQSVQRCSPDSTNVPHHSKNLRCEKTDCLCCPERKRQYSPNVRRNMPVNYNQNVVPEFRNSVNSKFSLSTASNQNSDEYTQIHSSSAKSSVSSSDSTFVLAKSSSSSLNKQFLYNNNSDVRAGSRQMSPSSVSNNMSCSLPNSSPLAYQTHLSHSMSSYNGAQRSIVNGTSGMKISPSVEIISQLSSKCDKKSDLSSSQSGKHLTNMMDSHGKKSSNLPFSSSKFASSTMGESSVKTTGNVMSHLFSQVENEVNESHNMATKDVMSHLFTQVEKELQDESSFSTKRSSMNYESGSVIDVFKKRKENMQVKTEATKTPENSVYNVNKDNSLKSETCTTNTASEEIAEDERYSSPLSICIPNGSSGPDSQNNIKSETKQIKCLSKKQLILNAVNKDEGLKKIVNSVIQKPKQRTVSPSEGVSRVMSHRNHNMSPTFPESPKMPTLSPQQKLPTPVVSPAIGEPPTLDAATTGYRQRPEKMSLLRKPILNIHIQNEKDSKTPLPTQSTFSKHSDGCGSKLQEYTSAFSKRPSMLQKRIPVANVAPMVHRSVQDDPEIVAQNMFSSTKADDCTSKESDKVASAGQITPFSTDIQTYNVSQMSILHKSKDCELDTSLDDETFSIFCEKSDHTKRLSPLMKKKIFQRHQNEEPVSPIEKSDAKSRSPSKQNELEKKRGSSLKQHQRQRQTQIRRLRNTSPSKSRTRKLTVRKGNCSTGKSNITSRGKRKGSEETSIVVHAKRKVWVSLTKTRHHMQLRNPNGGERQPETTVKRGESLRARKRRKHLRKTALKLCKPVNAKRAKALENIESKDVTNQDKDGESDKNRDGMWEVTGSGSTLRNGKPKGGLMLKLFFRPKKKRRFTRKQRRRGRSGINLTSADKNVLDIGAINKSQREAFECTGGNCKKGFRPRPSKHPRNGNSLQNIEEYGAMFEKDLPFTDELDTDSGNVTTELLVPQEVKRLAVCKDTGETPLHRAARMGRQDVAVYCLKSGTVEVNAKDNAGYTPLHECSVSGHMGIARLLLSYGANVNCSSQDGIRPIHDAVENDHLEIVRLLMTFGADPTISTYSGKTPVKIARSKKMQILIKGHLGDLNGFEQDQEESVWDIPSSYLAHGNIIPETNIFSNIPPDPEEETDDSIFQEFQEPTFSLFKLPQATQNKQVAEDIETVLLRDVTDYFKVNAVAIEKNSGIKSSINMSKDQLLSGSLSSTLYDRILCIPGTTCRLLRSQELSQIILKCERRVVRKYVRKNKTSDSSTKRDSSHSKGSKKRKDSTKSTTKVHLSNSTQANKTDAVKDGNGLAVNSNSSLHKEMSFNNSMDMNSNNVGSYKPVNDNNNSINSEYMLEEQASFGSVSDDDTNDQEFDPFWMHS